MSGASLMGGPIVAVDPKAPPPPAVQRFSILPNGLEVACQSAKETEHIFADIFDHRVYLSNGITLWDGACVFDVGGNIGLFTVFVHQTYRGARTYTFEPAPPLFEILRYNAARYGGDCRLFPYGVAARRGQATLTFYPYSSGMSSFHGDAREEKEVLRILLENQRRAGDGEAGSLLPVAEEFLDARFTCESFECPLVSLSEVIRQEGVGSIDLLKIDVQKSELEVLRGIAPEDWPKVRQVAIEVHDLDGQLARVRALLEAQGFGVVVEQDPLYERSVMYNLFAIRKGFYRDLAGRGAAAVSGAGDPARSRRSQRAFAQMRRQRRNP